jgi:hypothetical protein
MPPTSSSRGDDEQVNGDRRQEQAIHSIDFYMVASAVPLSALTGLHVA